MHVEGHHGGAEQLHVPQTTAALLELGLEQERHLAKLLMTLAKGSSDRELVVRA